MLGLLREHVESDQRLYMFKSPCVINCDAENDIPSIHPMMKAQKCLGNFQASIRWVCLESTFRLINEIYTFKSNYVINCDVENDIPSIHPMMKAQKCLGNFQASIRWVCLESTLRLVNEI
ncbi:uncharacterized protein ACN2A1_000584 [Glossina fuscipes fuscipes]